MSRLVRRPPPAAEHDNYPEFRERLKIDRDKLDQAVEEQSYLFLQVCEFHVRATSIRDDIHDRLAQLDARLAREFRLSQAKAGEKCTDSMVSDHLMLHPEHVALNAELNNRKAEQERWWALRSAFEQRQRMLGQLVNLHSSGYFSASGAMGPRNTVRDALAETARAGMDAARKARAGRG